MTDAPQPDAGKPNSTANSPSRAAPLTQPVAAETRRDDNLLSKMWRTKSAHFNASHRLERRHWWSIAATSMLSFYLLCAALYQLVFDSGIAPIAVKTLSVISIITSVLLIIITLIESAKNYAGESKQMRRSALDIAEVYNRFQALSRVERDQQRSHFAEKYSDVLKRHEVSHKDLDFLLFKYSNARDLDMSKREKCALIPHIIALTVGEYWLYAALILFPPITFWLFVVDIRACAAAG